MFSRLRKIFSSQVQSRVKKRKAGELLAHLQQLLRDPASEAATCLETLDYFLARYLLYTSTNLDSTIYSRYQYL